MFVPWLAWPLAVQLIVVADGVPKLDVIAKLQAARRSPATSRRPRTGCRTASTASSAPATSSSKDWASFPAADRTWCVSSIQGFQPTYSELATCLEMKRDLRT